MHKQATRNTINRAAPKPVLVLPTKALQPPKNSVEPWAVKQYLQVSWRIALTRPWATPIALLQVKGGTHKPVTIRHVCRNLRLGPPVVLNSQSLNLPHQGWHLAIPWLKTVCDVESMSSWHNILLPAAINEGQTKRKLVVPIGVQPN